jgi:TPR repeat protein
MARMVISSEKVELAAQSGAPDALFELGMLYATGRDGAPDLIVAHKWFNLAALRGNREALLHRRELAQEMSVSEIAEAQKLAREWMSSH